MTVTTHPGTSPRSVRPSHRLCQKLPIPASLRAGYGASRLNPTTPGKNANSKVTGMKKKTTGTTPAHT